MTGNTQLLRTLSKLQPLAILLCCIANSWILRWSWITCTGCGQECIPYKSHPHKTLTL
jgi:hypothetical protein